MERNDAGTVGDQREEMPSCLEEAVPRISHNASAPLNFSELTPSQFGISIQSFAPAPMSNPKDRSRLAQIKARRRSTIGVRGSPETNSLIRFMAKERMKTPPTLQTPELVRGSAFLPRVPSTLRQKMASFQDLMNVEENEACDSTPMQYSNTGGKIKTRDYLSDRKSHYGGKENCSSPVTPTPNKRRPLPPLETCQLEIRETSTPILQFTLKEQEEDKEPVKQFVTQGPLPSRETVEEAQPMLMSPPFHTDPELQAGSPSTNQEDSVFELQSPRKQLPGDDSAAAPPFRLESSLPIHFVPALLEMKDTEENASTSESTDKNKKKSVRFGCPLSPEFFDKDLPPSTPLQRGGMPARAATPGGSVLLRSVLKTPQRTESQSPEVHPDLSSIIDYGASPTFLMPSTSRIQSEREDDEETVEKIAFPSMEEIDSVVTCDTENAWNPQPLNLDTAFNEESLSLTIPDNKCETDLNRAEALTVPSVSVAEPNTTSPTGELGSTSEENQPEGQPTTHRQKRGPGSQSTTEAPARSSNRKRKLPEEYVPSKRPARSAAKSASSKIKIMSTAKRRWNKDVDRSLYSTRSYASRNPALSPITESLSFISQSPAAQHGPSTSYTASNCEINLNPEMINTATNIFNRPSLDSNTLLNSSKGSNAGKSGMQSGPQVGGLERRKVSVAESILLRKETLDQTGGEKEDHCENQINTSLEASRETPLTQPLLEQGGSDTNPNIHTSADPNSTDFDRNSECPSSLDVPPSDAGTTVGLPSEPAQRNTKEDRYLVHQEQGIQAEVLHMNHGEKEQEVEAASQHEPIPSTSGTQESGVAAGLELAPWQADFNFEDVFKPVPTRGQRSVRRSLRNQRNAGLSCSSSAGLAWLPQTSPVHSKEARRKTRGKRLSSAPPASLSLPEETHDLTNE
ncbi:cell division cycle-associated protein 2 [Antennarius striatus]|uniref:cell division cycle-associated protein 2 n=1 Tax=Antennarius striatus TaxID=241820 RepID=UPI0035B3C5BC